MEYLNVQGVASFHTQWRQQVFNASIHMFQNDVQHQKRNIEENSKQVEFQHIALTSQKGNYNMNGTTWLKLRIAMKIRHNSSNAELKCESFCCAQTANISKIFLVKGWKYFLWIKTFRSISFSSFQDLINLLREANVYRCISVLVPPSHASPFKR